MEKPNYTKWVEENHCSDCCCNYKGKCELEPDGICHFEAAWIACENAYRPLINHLEESILTLRKRAIKWTNIAEKWMNQYLELKNNQ